MDAALAFKECEPTVLAPLKSELLRETNPNSLRLLLRAVGMVPGGEADQLLVSVLFADTEPLASLRSMAMGELTWRINRKATLAVHLTAEQQDFVASWVRQGDALTAGELGRFLAHCTGNGVETRIHPVVEAFCREVEHPTKTGHFACSRFPARIHTLFVFLQAFEEFGEQCRPFLREAWTTADTEKASERVKWLTFALGMSGDRARAADLKAILFEDSDKYIRCVAVYAYARSEGQGALPLLRDLLNDKTVSDYLAPGGEQDYLIANAASDMLSELGDWDYVVEH